MRRLMVEFGETLSWTFVMGGLSREVSDPLAHAAEWLDVSARTGAPADPGLWTEGPIATTYPACMAVIAAAEQAPDGGYRYLRELREGLVCFRRKLDTTEALVEAAREAGLDVARFRIDLASHATVETFGAHLEEARALPAGQRFPALSFGGGPWLGGDEPYEALAAAAVAAGASAGGDRPDALGALRRFHRITPVEVEAVCGLPAPRAHAELWRLVGEWQVRPRRVLAAHLFELA